MKQEYSIERIGRRTDQEIEKLAEIWEASVRATHDFLGKSDIQGLAPEVKAGLKGVEKLMLAQDSAGTTVGFIGIDKQKIEMLFVEPKWFGKGVGSFLIRHAIDNCGATAVDVNEQNPGARGFYEHMGFWVASRSPLDEQGRGFPILHMERGAQTTGDITYCVGNRRFNFRAAALMIHEDRLLVMRDRRNPYCYLPGGRVSFGETAEEALRRELLEEMGLDLKIERLAWVAETFFTDDMSREHFHEIGFYYVVDAADENLLRQGEAFEHIEDNGNQLKFSWIPLDAVPQAYLYPIFIRDCIRDIPEQVEHIVVYE